MKKIITLVAVLAMVSSPAFAARKKKTTVKTTTETSVPVTTTYSSHSEAPLHSDLLLSGEFGLGTAADKFHFGVGFRAEFPMNLEGNHVRFGGQTGFYFGPSSPTTWMIPILAIGTFDFKVSSGTIKPYIGLGLGLAISHASTAFASASSTDFMWQFKPGASFGSNNMYVELPLGTIAGSFYILPSIGMHF
jgi:opacity protein-like surface antigen